MKKKILMRCLWGAPIGFMISVMMTIIYSEAVGDGNYYPVDPNLIAACGSQINAVLVQAFFALLYGAIWAGTSVLFEIENWSMLRQTVTHFLICSITTCPIAFAMHWMPYSVEGVLIYFAIFLVVYLCIWFGSYFAMKRRVREMDKKVKEDTDVP